MLRYEIHVIGSCEEANPFYPLLIAEYDDIWPLIESRFPLSELGIDLSLEQLNVNGGDAIISFWGAKRYRLRLDEGLILKEDLGEGKTLKLTLTLRAYECGEETYNKGFFLRVEESVDTEEAYDKQVGTKSYDIPIKLRETINLEYHQQVLTIVGIFPKFQKITVKIGPKRGQGKAYEISEDEPCAITYEDAVGAYESFRYLRKHLKMSLREDWEDPGQGSNP